MHSHGSARQLGSGHARLASYPSCLSSNHRYVYEAMGYARVLAVVVTVYLLLPDSITNLAYCQAAVVWAILEFCEGRC